MGSEPIYDYYSIIPNGHLPLVLMLETPAGWALPHFETDAPHYWPVVDHVNERFGEQLGLNLTALRCIKSRFDRATNRVHRLYDMENHTPGWALPQNAAWIDREQLTGLALAVAAHGPFLETWFTQAETGHYPELSPPWTRRGWYDRAAGWIADRLRENGLAPSGPLRQLRAWERSYLLQVPAVDGDYYFKALPAMFAHEPALTAALSGWHPGYFPEVIAMDTEMRCMLMRDFGGTHLDESAEIEVWEDAFRALARMQVDLCSKTEDLDKLGCPWRPLYWLSDRMDLLLQDTEALASPEEGLSKAEVEQLRSLAPQLQEMCEQLSFYRVPLSLDHGDLFSENIALTDSDRFLFFDWSDSSIAHPFFSMLITYSESASDLPAVPNVHDRLRNAYLEPWQTFEPMDRLVDAFSLAQVLGGVHAALGYHTHILPGMADKWEMENMIPFFLRMVLRNASYMI